MGEIARAKGSDYLVREDLEFSLEEDSMKSAFGGKRGKGEFGTIRKERFCVEKGSRDEKLEGGCENMPILVSRARILASELASKNIRGNRNQTVRELIAMTREGV